MKDATISRKGNDTVVGLSCSVYDIVHDGDQGEACITDDGLVLRSRSGAAGGPHTMEAVKVTYAPQPASLFVPPADFQKADVPALRGGMTMPPAGAPPAR
jgi:hypothetical protein